MERQLKGRRNDQRWIKESRTYEPGDSVNEHSMVEEGNHVIAEKEFGQIKENQ